MPVSVQQSDKIRETEAESAGCVFFAHKSVVERAPNFLCRPANEFFLFWKEREEQRSSSDVCFVLSSARVVDRAPLLLLSRKVLPKEL